jgi:hypothetical protein
MTREDGSMLRRLLIPVLSCWLLLAALAPVHACPVCAEAVSAGDGSGEESGFPEAMNQSIMLMIAVPYTAGALLCFGVYRGLKMNAAYAAKTDQPSEPLPK